MIIPISSGFANTNAAPSETNLLMALATMHAQGKFDTAGEPAPRSHHSPIEKETKRNG